MITILLIWYASAWVTITVMARDFGEITIFGLMGALCAGPLAIGFWCVSLCDKVTINRVIWRKK